MTSNAEEAEPLIHPNDGTSPENVDGSAASEGMSHSSQSTTPRMQVTSLLLSQSLASEECPQNNTVVISNSESALSGLTVPDMVVAAFVVAFDAQLGNMVEWFTPINMNLDGVEFKAMPSGSHTLDKDFVYFSHDHYFGLACFEQIPVSSDLERGVRMKSVGILTSSYHVLFQYLPFLESQVRRQLEGPGDYSHLDAFYEHKKAILPSSHLLGRNTSNNSNSSRHTHVPALHSLPLKVSQPDDCYTQFCNFFGAQIFALWRFVLLKKRILFYSPPPIGVVCYRVSCCCSLATHKTHAFSDLRPKPLFYVNVSDTETLESEICYVACTTEKIFQTKTHLYDVYVDNQNLVCQQEILREMMTSSADRECYKRFCHQRSDTMFGSQQFTSGTNLHAEDIFIAYFQNRNDRIFQTLLELASSPDRELTAQHMRTMGLDPQLDRTFIMELVECYGIDVMLMVDNSCCPR